MVLKPSAALVAVLLAGALAPAARAEPILDLGFGSGSPSAVTDGAGTLHAIWRDVRPFSDPVQYCRVPAGGTGCTQVAIAEDATAAVTLLVRTQDGALIALVPRLLGVDYALWTVTSVDGGASWAPPVQVATGLRDPSSAALTPDGTAIDVVSQRDGVLFQRVSLSGGESRVVRLDESGLAGPRLAHLADGRPVVTYERVAESKVRTRVPAVGADPNTPEAWAADTLKPLGGIGRREVDDGPTGTWLLTQDEGSDGVGFAIRAWRFSAKGFTLAQRIGALDRPQPQPLDRSGPNTDIAFDVDLAGRLHAVWGRDADHCGGRSCLVYRRTDRGGFGPPVTYPLPQEPDSLPTGLTAAANSGGSGWIVWRTLNDMHAVPLVTPPLGARVGSKRIERLRVSIPDVYGCVPTGGSLRRTLAVDGRAGSVRITSVRFFVDAGDPSTTVRRAPYRAAQPVAFAAGTRHVASATVSYRVGGRARTTTIGRTFVMC